MTLPIADMRGVKFSNEESVYSRRVGDLCERCGLHDTCNGSTARSNDLGVEIVVSECPMFQPILLFVKPIGKSEKFSTLRLGEAWVKRVREGSIVSLFSKKNGKYGEARVESVYSNSKAMIVYDSIYTNHMMLIFEGSPDERLTALNKIVKSAYGNMIWKHNDRATVINLMRLE